MRTLQILAPYHAGGAFSSTAEDDSLDNDTLLKIARVKEDHPHVYTSPDSGLNLPPEYQVCIVFQGRYSNPLATTWYSCVVETSTKT